MQISLTAKVLWVCGLGLALGLMWAGSHYGEPTRIMMNAFMLCLSCIGIG